MDLDSGLYDSVSYMMFGWLNSGDYVYVYVSRMIIFFVFVGW